MMDIVFNFIQTNPWASLIVFIAGIFSCIFGIVTWYRGRPKSEITVYKASQCLYSNERFGLEMCELRKENDIIDELYEAVFAIINTGNKRIDSSELAQSAPLKIQCDVKASDDSSKYGIIDFEFSSPDLVKKNSIIGNLDSEGKTLIINFEYLEKGEAIIVKIRYKGKGSFVYCGGNIKSGALKQRKKAHALCDQNMTGNLTPDELKDLNARRSGIRGLLPYFLSGGLLGLILSMMYFVFDIVDDANKPAAIVFFFILQGVYSLVFAWAIKKDSQEK